MIHSKNKQKKIYLTEFTSKMGEIHYSQDLNS
jgi:hypothetical protein